MTDLALDERPPAMLAAVFWSLVAICWLLGPLSFLFPWWKTAFASLLALPALALLLAGRIRLGQDASHRLLVMGSCAALVIAVCACSTIANGSSSDRLLWFISRYALNPLLMAVPVVLFLERCLPVRHQRVADACLALCALQAPFYLAQKHWLFTEDYPGNYFDRWTGSFPIFADFAMGFFCNMALAYVLWLRQEGAYRLSRWRLAALLWTLWLTFDQNSNMNRMLGALTVVAFGLRWAHRQSDRRVWWAAILAVVTALSIGLGLVWQDLSDGLAWMRDYMGERGYWRYLAGTQSDRPGGVIYLLVADHPFFGFGTGLYTYTGAIGQDYNVAQTRGMLFAPYLETGWPGLLALYAFAFAHLRGISNVPSLLLAVGTLAVGFTQELTNLLSMCLSFHVFAFLFAQPPTGEQQERLP